MRRSASPIIAAVLLLMPVFYVGSYLALVVPGDRIPVLFGIIPHARCYRWESEWAERIFWPLEQIDRRLRPRAWESSLILRRSRN